MSSQGEEKDQDQKTEEPTAHKLQQAFEKGQVVFSREVTHWFALGGFALSMAIFFPFSIRYLKDYLTFFIISAHELRIDQVTSQQILETSFIKAAVSLLPLFGMLMAAAIAAGLLQTRLAIQFDAMLPKLNRISISSGIKRIFSVKSVVDFLKSLAKLAIISICLYIFLKNQLFHLDNWADMEPVLFFPTVKGLVLKCLIIILCLLTLIAILDYLYQKYEFIKNLRMTPDEIKKEFKETEGDPQIKQRRRQIAQERVRKAMMSNVPKATVILTNPTHFSVALRYEHETMDAPIVVAKGVDLIALKIREIGRENNIPIVENAPLARALYKSVEIDQEIPPEHYKAVADVIRFVMNLKNRLYPGA